MSSALERPRTDATELAATQCRRRVDHRLGRDAGGVETGLLGEPRDQVDHFARRSTTVATSTALHRSSSATRPTKVVASW